jgi:hypothetical protein
MSFVLTQLHLPAVTGNYLTISKLRNSCRSKEGKTPFSDSFDDQTLTVLNAHAMVGIYLGNPVRNQ